MKMKIVEPWKDVSFAFGRTCDIRPLQCCKYDTAKDAAFVQLLFDAPKHGVVAYGGSVRDEGDRAGFILNHVVGGRVAGQLVVFLPSLDGLSIFCGEVQGNKARVSLGVEAGE